MDRSAASAPGAARLGDLSTEKIFRLKKPLKQPQNATDVITIVMFHITACDPDASLHRLRRHLDGPHPRRDPALV